MSPTVQLPPAMVATSGDLGLRACERLLAEHLDAVERRFGAYGLGLVDLPPLGPELLVAAQIRVGAALLWCRELERAGILPLVEAITQAFAQGSLPIGDPDASQRLYAFWRRGDNRFDASERTALYERTLGPQLDEALERMVNALAEIGRARLDVGIADLRARFVAAAVEVGRMLSEHAVGLAAFAAREIVTEIGEAIALLSHPAIAAALGGGTPWQIVLRWGPRLLDSVPRLQRVQRARAGMYLVRWLADHARNLDAAARGLSRGDGVVHAAEAWRVASRGR